MSAKEILKQALKLKQEGSDRLSWAALFAHKQIVKKRINFISKKKDLDLCYSFHRKNKGG